MKNIFLIIILPLFAVALSAQNPKQDFEDGEFFLAQEEYEEALYTYTKAYNAGYEDNANVNYRIGICLLQIPGRKAEAIPYLEKAVTMVSEKYKEGSFSEVNTPPDAHLYLGNAYRINHEFEKSCEQYRIFEEYVGTQEDIQSVFAEQQILSCSNAVVALNNPVDFRVGNLGQMRRTHDKIYNMVVSDDMKTMAFMGRNPFYAGIYVSRKENGLWTVPLGINASVMSEGNMEVVSLSPDGNTILLVVMDAFGSNLYKTEWADGRWNPAESLGKPINSRYFESHGCFSPDMQSIYFTSNRKESIGAMDLFRSDVQEDGSWGEPVSLGEVINTKLNEETPMISPDGKRLYFASQGHNSIGGFDVFYSEMQEDGNWGTPVNLGYPLNTTDDDFTLSPNGFQEDETMFLFSNSGDRQYPVFKFEMIERETSPEEVAFDPVLPETEALDWELAADTAYAEEETTTETETATEKETAPPPPPAPVMVTPEKYLIHAVFFDFDSYALGTDSREELNDIAEVLNSFPGLNLDITGHTDAVGSISYNQVLSERRARAVKDYLVSRGVDSDRLEVHGKSENDAVARNRTRDNHDAPDGRKLNRRVEFKVSTSKQVIVEMEEIEVPDHLKLN